MGDFRARLFDEHSQLNQKIERLKQFILSGEYEKLPEVDRSDLKTQLGYMQQYQTVLTRRVSRQCGGA